MYGGERGGGGKKGIGPIMHRRLGFADLMGTGAAIAGEPASFFVQKLAQKFFGVQLFRKIIKIVRGKRGPLACNCLEKKVK